MSLISSLKKLKINLMRNYKIRQEYKNDCKQYLKYNYNSPQIHTQNAFEAKILRQAHILEKGMSLTIPKDKFGVEKANILLDMIMEFLSEGFSFDKSTVISNALGIVNAYLNFHAKKGYFPEEIISKYNSIMSGIINYNVNGIFGVQSITKQEMDVKIHSEFPDFFISRHSIRQFDDTPVDLSSIRSAVTLAMKAPSACNRQSCKVYFYNNSKVNYKLGNLISGNNGFDNEVQNYLVITSDISAFYDSFERNQTYVDAGIFTMALTEALHYYRVGSCILQNGEIVDKNKKIREICDNIPENEKIVLFIAIGNYKDNIVYAVSKRKSLEDILIIK